MAILVECPGCRAQLAFSDSLDGQTMRCGTCAAEFVVRGRVGDRAEEEETEGHGIQQVARPHPRLPGGGGNPPRGGDDERTRWVCGPREEDPAQEDDRRSFRRSKPSSSSAWIIVVSVAACFLVLLALLLVGVVVWLTPTYRATVPPQAPGGQPPLDNDPLANVRLRASYFVADPSCLSLSADGARLAIGSYDKTVRVYDVRAHKEIAVLAGHDGIVCSVALAPDGKSLASAGRDRVVHLWDLARKERLHTIEAKSEQPVVQFMPDGKALAIAGWGDGVRLLDVATKKVIATAEYDGEVNHFAITPDGRFVAMANRDIRVWDLSTRKESARLNSHAGIIGDVAMSADGSVVASGNTDGTIQLWDVKTGEVRRTLKERNCVTRLIVTDDGRRLASGAQQQGKIRLWDAGTGRHIAALPMFGPMLFTPDGKTLVAGEDRHWVKSWDLSQLPGW
jgi:tricorn protease-like protein